jgi:uncharacterized protein (TIGR00251 family)
MAVIAVKVVPRAASDEIVGFAADVLKVRVTAAPEDGRANRALEKLLATALGLKRSAVRVSSGHSSAHKRVTIEGLERDEALGLLSAAARG